jgi:hypothetical protein
VVVNLCFVFLDFRQEFPVWVALVH